MSTLLGLLQSFLASLSLLLSFLRDKQLREEGERKVEHENLETAYEQQKKAHEIDLKIANGELTDADREWLRKFKRD